MESVEQTVRFVVVGPGRLGNALLDGLLSAGRDVSGVVLHRELPTRNAAKQQAIPVSALDGHAGVIFLTVPDDRIAQVAAQLPVDGRHTVVHCSGARTLAELSAAAARGARVACFHPLQAFPAGAGRERFHGITVGIEGDDCSVTMLSALASDLGAQPLSLAGVDRAGYHAAAVFSSNYLVALMKAATDAWIAAGLPESAATPALLPLMRGAFLALEEKPLRAALTGPLSRGDVSTIRGHMLQLQGDQLLERTYADLALVLTRLGLPAESEVRAALVQLLMDRLRATAVVE